MFRNFIKITFRNFFRERTYTVINVTGLAIGLCSCIAIFVIASYEYSFDAFHKDGKKTYRVMMDITEKSGDKNHFSRSPIPLGAQLRKTMPELDAAAAVIPYDAKIKIVRIGQVTEEFESHMPGSHFSTTVIAEPEWFSFFDYTWLAGSPAQSLQTISTTILTESRARQYFGNTTPTDIIGKQVIYGDSLVAVVSGILKDWPAETDLGFTDFISSETLNTGFLQRNFNTSSWNQREMQAWTFIKLKGEAKTKDLDQQLVNLVNASSSELQKPSPWLQPLADIHFNADIIENPIRTAHRPTLYGLIIIASFILLLAIINFINLSTAQSLRRFKEAGIRKILGSGRGTLITHYLAETFLLTLCAAALALCLVQPVLNAFHNFIPAGAGLNVSSPGLAIFLLLMTVMVTLLSGTYPAWMMSSASPAVALRNAEQPGSNRWLLRKGLIVFQFSVSLVFIIGVIVLKNQLNYMRNKDLGFKPGAIVMINTPFGDSMSRVTVLESAIQQVPGVNATALQWVPPMVDNGRGRNIKFSPADQKETGVVQVSGNERFIGLYQIQLLAGRNLEASDTMKEIIINETLLKMMGYTQPIDAIGKLLYWSDVPYPVVGVVKDFHSRSLHEAISPVCIVHRKDREATVAVKLEGGDMKKHLNELEIAFRKIYPGKPFSYSFYDDTLAQLYSKDEQTATLVSASMVITIFISCFGLFGLALFTARKRAKEISVRKILGASVSGLTAMLCRDFMRLVLIALVISIPISWYAANQWLANFAYRISVSWWMFLLAGVVAFVITILTVGFQALKAAMVNPVDNLRNE